MVNFTLLVSTLTILFIVNPYLCDAEKLGPDHGEDKHAENHNHLDAHEHGEDHRSKDGDKHDENKIDYNHGDKRVEDDTHGDDHKHKSHEAEKFVSTLGRFFGKK